MMTLLLGCLLYSLVSQRHPCSDKDVVSTTTVPLLECWDDCLEPSILHDIILPAGVARSHSFTSVFDRRGKPRSILEHTIQVLLRQVEKQSANNHNNNDFFVEYWWRDARNHKIRSLEAHRDVDETLCRKVQTPVSLGSNQKIGLQKCPTFGHVFYVDISSNVLAPTVVLQEEEQVQGQGRGGPPRKLTSLWSVPACSNRLLRFAGDLLHAVSYPPLEFLVDHEQQPVSLEEEDAPRRRAVLLFNTWETPPLYPAIGEPLSSAERDLFKHFNAGKERIMHQSFHQSTTIRPAAIQQDSASSSTVELSIPLLGDYSRRGCPEPSLSYFADKEKAVSALTSPRDVHGLHLYSSRDECNMQPEKSKLTQKDSSKQKQAPL